MQNIIFMVVWSLGPDPSVGVLPYMSYIDMCGPKGFGFSVVLVINVVSILVDFSHFGHKENIWVWNLHSSLDKKPFFRQKSTKTLHQLSSQ